MARQPLALGVDKLLAGTKRRDGIYQGIGGNQAAAHVAHGVAFGLTQIKTTGQVGGRMVRKR